MPRSQLQQRTSSGSYSSPPPAPYSSPQAPALSVTGPITANSEQVLTPSQATGTPASHPHPPFLGTRTGSPRPGTVLGVGDLQTEGPAPLLRTERQGWGWGWGGRGVKTVRRVWSRWCRAVPTCSESRAAAQPLAGSPVHGAAEGVEAGAGPCLARCVGGGTRVWRCSSRGVVWRMGDGEETVAAGEAESTGIEFREAQTYPVRKSSHQRGPRQQGPSCLWRPKWDLEAFRKCPSCLCPVRLPWLSDFLRSWCPLTPDWPFLDGMWSLVFG